MTDQLLDRLAEWLAIDSTTGREARFLETLEDDLRALGLTCRRQPIEDDRWNLLAAATYDPSLIFCTHVDTVPPHLPVEIRGDAVYGRGACDTKGGLLAMMRATARLLERGGRDLGLLLVVGEEVDHRGARAARSLDLSPDRIVLCEPTRNRAVAGQKGMAKLDLRAEGSSAHSAFPDRGESAVHRLLDAVDRLRSHDWPTDETLGQTTLNVGTIEGGVAANVLAPSATAELLVRTVSPAGELIERIEKLAGGVEVDPVSSNDPLTFDPPAGVETTVVPFNTDAPYLVELGPVWLVGPGDIEYAHSDEEHIELEALREGIDLYTELGERVIG
ncbi:MAG: M20/M25/M40 family metallo-hydrolase [Bradymonadaceae bacterium]